MNPLAIVILALLTVKLSAFGMCGPLYAPHLRNHPLGPETRAMQLAEQVDESTRVAHVPIPLFTALLRLESAIDHNAVNPVTGAEGGSQLKPGTPWHRDWLKDCARDPYVCEQANLWHGARVLRHGLDICHGDQACAVARYRGVKQWSARAKDRDVVQLSRTIAWRLEHPSHRPIHVAVR